MADRKCELRVSGLSRGGYLVTVAVHEVDLTKLLDGLVWLGKALTEAGVAPYHDAAPPGDNGNNNTIDTKICPIHKVPMQRHDKGKSHWYSHKVTLEDGSEHWCRGK